MEDSQRKQDSFKLKSLITEYRNGSQSALAEIFELCEPMAKSMSKKYWSIAMKRNFLFEDLKQEAYIGLLGAINNFQIKENNDFVAYALTAMNYSILVYIRNNSNRIVKTNVNKGFADMVSMNKTLSESTDTTLGEMLTDEDQEAEFFEIEKLIDNEILKKNVQNMLHDIINDDSEISLLNDIYGLNGITYSLSEICERNQISMKELIFKERMMILQIRNKPRIENYLEKFDYHCKEAYKYGVQRFNDTRISSTEFIAFMNLEAENDLKGR
ncbi:sigma-70 family RNA polymerase sigma factor [Alkaliphilus serpentinus]|uniref:Sigma-70 family RNA polymerase sigma factor n=1 Tax=Alkaliphilus serpentinus TaxID=1482731 RepID=A0A833HLZ2_9FIRM|nr:sigma-70 family RNA polymerase sigma factor [Alkaliphilus serpentinus]KAB3527114.1 sigma-70 family RNA polymerase sigma factor [Alkaliphilus serpentinus]